MRIDFARLQREDLPLLLKWLQTEHVRKWWDSDINWDEKKISEKYGSYVEGYKVQDNFNREIFAYIILINSKKAGFISLHDNFCFMKLCRQKFA